MGYYEYDGELVDQIKLDPKDHNLALIILYNGDMLEVDYWTTRLIGGACYVPLQDLNLTFEWKTLRR